MIYVIDDLMGTGKSTWMIAYINTHPEERFLCVLPSLDECARYKMAIEAETLEPQKWGSKYRQFLGLIDRGTNIVTTHALIQKMDSEALERLRGADYTLVIDESLDVLSPFPLTTSDAETLFNDNKLGIDEDGYLIWKDSEYGGRFDDVRKLCELKSLMGYVRDDGKLAKVIMWNFPSVFFECFNDGYILTYLWESSIQRTYFDLHRIRYEVKMLDVTGNNLIPFDASLARTKRERVAPLLNICEADKLNRIGKRIGKSYPLSKGWYRTQHNRKSNLLKEVKGNTENYFRTQTRTACDENMFTVYDSYKRDVKGKGFSKDAFKNKNLSPEKRKKKNSCFVPCNSRGTNDFRHKTALAYLIDFHCHPDVRKFVDHYGLEFDEDAFALSALLQWIWRSAIRDGKPINLYIPSERMRNLLKDWQNCADLSEALTA